MTADTPQIVSFGTIKGAGEGGDLIQIDVEHANQLGCRHYLSANWPAAEECFLAVLKANPGHAHAWGNLGLVWYANGHKEDALKCFLNSHAIDPANPANLTSIGYYYEQEGMLEHAIRHFERALEIEPTQARATANLAHCLLKRHDFKRAWPLLEARFRTLPQMSFVRNYNFPLWDGKPVKKLAIWPEQGVGDQLVYSTLLPELIGEGQDFVCEVDERLLPAFHRSFPTSQFVPRKHEHGFDGCDAHVPLMSMAQYFRNSVEEFIAQPKRLLRADVGRAGSIRAALSTPERKTVAIAWRSFNENNFNIAKLSAKSASLDIFIPLAAREDLRLVSVQYGDVEAEIEGFRQAEMHLDTLPAIDNFKDIDGVLAIIEACDVCVTTSNVTAHFAGAIGKETYLLLRGTEPFFYWCAGANGRSLWWPSVRIILEPTWEACIARVMATL